ncbi:hypothetical protein Kpol_1040p12 [Vanderwaltozyma polyspora DSM 70294]|uniref:Dolichyl-phosphate-mannose--protein mannosyltransferase n=1 Tax=Vanderwaltozyma polyspora (strain ATCC 22028 / DSM 70294 / BCRC 21397 / CBS 2163 / NBRC 10782 / NRRL Y-8283 / UCD 57-17) TaxID=436907 RepID=A7TPK7_VANPO|nr:uncharacterized protein Kpol_1040p12 [Vanderwaltozyma polyspora DSM 70294]EDO15799.1 hypothetical protein Kpol_1040p12 [Vanderwaltozyma polyspora DSM 70294]
MAVTTGFQNSEKESLQEVTKRKNENDSINELINEKEDLSKAKSANADEDSACKGPLYRLEAILMPIIFTAVAFFTRMYKIGANNHVVWDEAHFGKFGSFYLRHEFYHDVHPPLGKMLVGLSGYIAGYNGSWDFPSGHEYPDYIDFVKMRLFNATFSALCVPLAYYTAKALKLSLPSVWLFTVLVLFENSYSTLGRMILLDSMLLFFTVASFFCFIKFHNQRNKPFSCGWWSWMFFTGLSLGCTISVKMVGLFIITLVGIYTVVDLWIFLGDKKMSWKTYSGHWLARIICLIMVPIAVFMICFKIHFSLLTHSGKNDAVMPSLFQANLIGNTLGQGPRDVALGSSTVSIRNQALGGALLHSHVQGYPAGSKQQQVTGYGHQDANNDWIFHRIRQLPLYNANETDIEYILDGETYRLVHKNTNKNLHSHQVAAPVSSTQWEVSGYGDHNTGDNKDNWIVEVVDQKGSEDKSKLHPLTTSFRLKHAVLGCYLAQSSNRLPEWGFSQSEVICLKNPFKRDKRTWWNIELHVNEKLPTIGEDYKFPGNGFLKDFVYLNLAMMSTNNALVTDPDKLDRLASSAWQWPTLNTGLRLNGWHDDNVKYYLMGTPASTWASTAAVLGFMVLVIILVLRWQRQYNDYQNSDKVNLFLMAGVYPMFGWGLHFCPFVIMARVTYVHHYLPALYFALIVLVYFFEAGTQLLTKTKTGRMIRIGIFATYITAVIACFWYFSPITFGMDGPNKNYSYLAWLPGWDISEK